VQILKTNAENGRILAMVDVAQTTNMAFLAIIAQKERVAHAANV